MRLKIRSDKTLGEFLRTLTVHAQTFRDDLLRAAGDTKSSCGNQILRQAVFCEVVVKYVFQRVVTCDRCS